MQTLWTSGGSCLLNNYVHPYIKSALQPWSKFIYDWYIAEHTKLTAKGLEPDKDIVTQAFNKMYATAIVI